jgi:hypothetical protein
MVKQYLQNPQFLCLVFDEWIHFQKISCNERTQSNFS